jgi:DedD protein
MAERVADNPELIVDEMKRKARRRLVGAIVLALAAAIIVPMLLEKEPRPLGDDVSVQIPPVDEGRFVNRLTGKAEDRKPLPKADTKAGAGAAGKPEPKAEVPAQMAAPAGAAPAPTAAVSEPAAPRKTVADAEQRVIAPAAKGAPKTEAKAAPAPKNDAKPAPKAEAVVVPAPKAEVKPAPAGDAASVPEPSGSAKPATAETKPATAEAKPATGTVSQAPAAASAAAPAKAEGFVVQLAAFADDKGANALANKLKKSGYAAFVQPVETSRGTLWRVRVGGYGSRPEAETARVALKGEGYSGIVASAQ